MQTVISIPVAVGVIVREKKVLIAQRPAKAYLAGQWEFPGGKLEPGEHTFNALCRELYEELAIEIISANHMMNYAQQYGDKSFHLDIWLVEKFQGEPKGVEGQLISWVTLDELDKINMLEGNKPIVSYLKNIIMG